MNQLPYSSISRPPRYRNEHRLTRIGKLANSGKRGYANSAFKPNADSVAECRKATKTATNLENVNIFEGNMAAEISIRQDMIDDGMAILILNDNGLIQHCNRRICVLIGRQPSSLIWGHVSAVLPQLGEITLINNEQINPRLRFLARIGHRFELVGQHGIRFKCELFLNYKEYQGRHSLQVIIHPMEMVTDQLQ